ncbi:MAG: hypothetical protein E6Q92_13600 [Burkholderiaceae bacterium]|nr:MAG: hypothetical protein E6Q92_13600 [Burkholderiaceae bacterium]
MTVHTMTTHSAPERSRWQRLLQHPQFETFCHLIWLFFLFIPALHVVTLADGQPIAFRWDATLLAIAAYLPLHFLRARLTHEGRLAGVSLATFTIGLLLFPVNYCAHTFFIYASLPNLRASMRYSVAQMLAGIALSTLAYRWWGVDWSAVGITAGLISGVGSAMLGAQAAKEKQAQLRQKDHEIEALAKMAERERIARDLHDLLGHTLSVIALKSELAHKLAAKGGPHTSQAIDEMKAVSEVARSSLAEVRETLAGMRNMGLMDALSRAESGLRSAGLTVEVSVAPREAWPVLGIAAEHALAQAVLEASTNVIRHAHAKHTRLVLLAEPGRLTFSLEDDGQLPDDIQPGHGLKGMRERLEQAGGSLILRALSPGLHLGAQVPAQAH